MGERHIPEATVARLPVYLRSLLEVAAEGTSTISSERLAEMAGVNAAKVRKDLSYLGSFGTRGVGYDVQYLLFEMSRELGLTQAWPVAIVGVEHPHTGEAVKAYVRAADGAHLDEEELFEFCAKRLARYKCPTKVLFVDDVPTNAAGKILRRALR